MLKTKKILLAGVMTALLGSTSFVAAKEHATHDVELEITVGPKKFGDKFKISSSSSNVQSSMQASDTRGSHTIRNFIEWTESVTENIGIKISTGPKDGSSYVIESGADKIPVVFHLGTTEINDTPSKFALSQNDAKDLEITYGDGSTSYPSGTYTGTFTFSIESDF
ncbi:hypothetical protein [Cysteiniphilum sp. 6C5]|uniref:hypothetical protein n=1 Tax=unclassified Cysteiniphilum TaxID=2610889 RepID=UPI003F87C8A1